MYEGIQYKKELNSVLLGITGTQSYAQASGEIKAVRGEEARVLGGGEMI